MLFRRVVMASFLIGGGARTIATGAARARSHRDSRGKLERFGALVIPRTAMQVASDPFYSSLSNISLSLS